MTDAETTSDNWIVVAWTAQGFIVKAAGMSFQDAHDLREDLEWSGVYRQVSVGAIGSYFRPTS